MLSRDCHIWLLPRLSVISCFLHRKWLPAEIVHEILLSAETLGRKLNHMDNLCRKLFTEHSSLGRKQEIADSLSRSQICWTVSAGSINWRTHLYPVIYMLCCCSDSHMDVRKEPEGNKKILHLPALTLPIQMFWKEIPNTYRLILTQ